jgi:hypothetical protein
MGDGTDSKWNTLTGVGVSGVKPSSSATEVLVAYRWHHSKCSDIDKRVNGQCLECVVVKTRPYVGLSNKSQT